MTMDFQILSQWQYVVFVIYPYFMREILVPTGSFASIGWNYCHSSSRLYRNRGNCLLKIENLTFSLHNSLIILSDSLWNCRHYFRLLNIIKWACNGASGCQRNATLRREGNGELTERECRCLFDWLNLETIRA